MIRNLSLLIAVAQMTTPNTNEHVSQKQSLVRKCSENTYVRIAVGTLVVVGVGYGCFKIGQWNADSKYVFTKDVSTGAVMFERPGLIPATKFETDINISAIEQRLKCHSGDDWSVVNNQYKRELKLDDHLVLPFIGKVEGAMLNGVSSNIHILDQKSSKAWSVLLVNFQAVQKVYAQTKVTDKKYSQLTNLIIDAIQQRIALYKMLEARYPKQFPST